MGHENKKQWEVNLIFAESTGQLVPLFPKPREQENNVLLLSQEIYLPHSAPSWILSYVKNLASSSLQDGAMKWHCYPDKITKNPPDRIIIRFCGVPPYTGVGCPHNFVCSVPPGTCVIPVKTIPIRTLPNYPCLRADTGLKSVSLAKTK